MYDSQTASNKYTYIHKLLVIKYHERTTFIFKHLSEIVSLYGGSNLFRSRGDYKLRLGLDPFSRKSHAIYNSYGKPSQWYWKQSRIYWRSTFYLNGHFNFYIGHFNFYIVIGQAFRTKFAYL